MSATIQLRLCVLLPDDKRTDRSLATGDPEGGHMRIDINDVKKYYSQESLDKKLQSSLQCLGKALNELTIDDLALVDEFHVRGQAATNEVIAAARFSPGSAVLDLGCGLGGSARRLASRANCRVTGLDLCDEYIVCAQYLTRLLNLEDLVRFESGSCLEMPFQDGAFDGVMSIQMMMNVDDKARLFAQVKRVLKTGGKLVLYEVLAGNGEPLHFPVPWAQEPKHNSLCSAIELEKLLSDNGFRVESWQDKTEVSKGAFAGMPPPSRDAKLPALGIHLLVGDDVLVKAYNVKRNLDEGRISLAQVVAVKA